MNVSATVAAWIAVGAAALALVAVVVAIACWLRLRRVRGAQRVLLAGGRSDMVDFAVSLQGRIDDLHRAVDEIPGGLARGDGRADRALAHRAIVRYDAYENTGGQQSASVALLDATR